VDRVRLLQLLQLRDVLQAEETELKETLTAVQSALGGVEKLLARSGSPAPETREVPLGFDAVLEAPDRPSHPAPTEESPRGARAVEVILMEAGTWMTAQELTQAEMKRGWPPESSEPVNAVRAAANRLIASKPDLFVREQGRYRYQGPGQQASLNGDGPEQTRVQEPSPPADQRSPSPQHDDWQGLARTEAVARMLAEMDEPLSPSDLSRMLEAVGRDDTPLAVGKALNHLWRKGRANTRGRAKWVLIDPNTPQASGEFDAAEEVTDDQEVNGTTPTLTGGERWS
jgi:hypothetical protein